MVHYELEWSDFYLRKRYSGSIRKLVRIRDQQEIRRAGSLGHGSPEAAARLNKYPDDKLRQHEIIFPRAANPQKHQAASRRGIDTVQRQSSLLPYRQQLNGASGYCMQGRY